MWVCLCVSVLEMESTQAGLLTLRDRETLVVNLEEDDNETVVWLGEGGGEGDIDAGTDTTLGWRQGVL